MTEREQRIRDTVTRLTMPGTAMSFEYPLLTISDTQFLLEELTIERGSLKMATADQIYDAVLVQGIRRDREEKAKEENT